MNARSFGRQLLCHSLTVAARIRFHLSVNFIVCHSLKQAEFRIYTYPRSYAKNPIFLLMFLLKLMSYFLWIRIRVTLLSGSFTILDLVLETRRVFHPCPSHIHSMFIYGYNIQFQVLSEAKEIV